MSEGALAGLVIVSTVVVLCLVPVALVALRRMRDFAEGRTDDLRVLPGPRGEGPVWDRHPPRRPH